MSSHTVETQTQTTPRQMQQHQQLHHQHHQVAHPQPRCSYISAATGLRGGEDYAAASAEQLFQQQVHPAQQQYASQQMQRGQIVQPQSHAAGLTPGNKVLAERYKTKVCKNYIEMGMCPYESRCMFAHGDDELRTAEMNLHDGIVTEEAIRHFKRMQAYKQQAQQAAVDASTAHLHSNGSGAYTSGQHQSVGSMAHGPPSYEVSSFASPDHHSSGHFGDSESGFDVGSRKNSSHCMSFTHTGEQYCYDPYGWTPYHNGGNPHCQCADCLYNLEVAYSSAATALRNQQQAETGEEEAEQMESGEYAEEDATTAADETTTIPHHHHEIIAVPQKTAASSKAQADVAGHALRRPMMP